MPAIKVDTEMCRRRKKCTSQIGYSIEAYLTTNVTNLFRQRVFPQWVEGPYPIKTSPMPSRLLPLNHQKFYHPSHQQICFGCTPVDLVSGQRLEWTKIRIIGNALGGIIFNKRKINLSILLKGSNQ